MPPPLGDGPQPHHTRRPTAALGDIAESGTGMTVWCDDDACAYRRDNGHRYHVIYTSDNPAAFAETYGPSVILIDWQKRRSLGLR